MLLCQPRQIELPQDDMDAVGCFLEYLYTGDYFPKKVPGQRTLETDPSIPKVDESGEQLLKHARVYTLAEKFQVPNLRTLASSKIHCVNSTAKGEIAYARYVYAYTSEADSTVRAPVANFWANRSHTLRAEAEPEFKALCLEYPQFGYDVLSELISQLQCLVGCSRLLTMIPSTRPRRQAQAREQRQDAPSQWQRPQATPSQQQRLSSPKATRCSGLIVLQFRSKSREKGRCSGASITFSPMSLFDGRHSSWVTWSWHTGYCSVRSTEL